MSTYFNVVNLDKKEQASLVIVKGDKEVNATIEKWEAENQNSYFDEKRKAWHEHLGYEVDPEGYKKTANSDGKWIIEIKPHFQHQMKLVFGFIFWSACTDAWGHTSSWYGDRVVIIDDNKSPIRSCDDWYEIAETYKKVAFRVSYAEWKDAQK